MPMVQPHSLRSVPKFSGAVQLRFSTMPFTNCYMRILNSPTSVCFCRLLPLPVQPRCQFSVALGRGPILVQVILIRVRLKERWEMSLNRDQGFVVGCGNPVVKTWVH
jgi:hypothetical protein